MEAQAEPVETGKGVLGQVAGRFLPDALEHDVARVVEDHAGKAPGGIGDDEGNRDHGGLVRRRGHRIDRFLIGIGQGKHRRLRQQHQRHGHDNPLAQGRLVLRPEIGKEALERGPVVGFVPLVGGDRIGRHGPLSGASLREGQGQERFCPAMPPRGER